MRGIDFQRPNRCSADLRFPNQERAVPSKVPGPRLKARVEEHDDVSRFVVAAAEVRAFRPIALVATPREIIGPIVPAVLAREDVFNVKRVKGIIAFVNAAIFATAAGPLADQSANRRDHDSARFSNSLAWACR